MLDKWRKNQIAKDKAEIAAIEVKGVQGLRQKAQAVRTFIANHPDVANQDTQKAAELVMRLVKQIRTSDLLVEFKRLGILKKADVLKLTITVNNKKVYEFKSEDKVKSISFMNNKEKDLSWQPGDLIIIEVWSDRSWMPYSSLEKLGTKEINDPLAIRKLEGTIYMKNKNDGSAKFKNNRIKLTCDVLGWSAKDWTLVQDWIAPGKKWNCFLCSMHHKLFDG